MKGEKTINFDFAFQYSEGGKFAEASSITVRAPGLGKFDVHTTMSAYVGKAALAFTRLASEMPQQAAAEADDDSGEPKTDDQDVMQLMAMGLGVDEFPKFAMYVKRALTGTPKLAHVTDTKIGLTDEIWESIEAGGGMEAVQKVMSDFAGFFFEALGGRRAKANGAEPAPTSASPTKAASPMRPRATSRISN